jgi:hypothetical protein
MSVKRTGNTKRRLERLAQEVGRKAERGLFAAANTLLDFSLQEVPRETDALAESACISQEGEGLTSVFFVGYGLRRRYGRVVRGPGEGFTKQCREWKTQAGTFTTKVPANYAWIQHFNTTFKHPIGKSHFLTDPSKSKMPEMRAAFRRAYREGT